jgi:N-formylglutamate amidohydrolase
MTDTATTHSSDELLRVVDASASTPVILHAPHGGRAIPAEYLADFLVSASGLEAEKDAMTDHYTDTLVAGTTGASAIINGLSRFAVDVERFPDDSEEMNQVGMGVLYTHGSRRQEIRWVSPANTAPLLERFAAYSARFTELVDATLAVHGRAVIIDVHSYPEHELAYELHGGGYRAPLCVGFDPFHASDHLLAAVAESFAHLDTSSNAPFAGAYVPLKHYQRDARVSSVMLEIRRDTYMDEASVTLRPEGFQQLQNSLQRLVDRVSGRASSLE